MSKKELPEGYEIPIHRSVVMPLFWAGVPRNLFLANIFNAIFCVIIFGTSAVIAIAIGLHFIFRYLGKKDPQFHEVFWRARTHKTHYYR